jgi:hypothetical protein
VISSLLPDNFGDTLLYPPQGIPIRQHHFLRGIIASARIRFGRGQPDKEFHRLGGSLHAVCG